MDESVLRYDIDRSTYSKDRPSTTLLRGVPPGFSTRLKLFASDFLGIAVALVCALALSYNLSTPAIADGVSFSTYIATTSATHGALLLLFIGLLMYGGLYRRSCWETRELEQIAKGAALLGLFHAALVLTGEPHSATAWMLTIWPISAMLIFVFRMALRTVSFGFPEEVQYVFLAGGGIDTGAFRWEFRGTRRGPVRVLQRLPLKFIASFGKAGLENRIKIACNRFMIPRSRIKIIVTPSRDEMSCVKQFVAMLERLQQPYSVMLPYPELAQRGLALHEVLGADFVLADLEDGPSGRIGQLVKRGMDLLIAISATLLLTPLLLTIALLLKLEGGSVLFTQQRVGQNGRRFACFKFRSMVPDAERQLEQYLSSNLTAREEWEHHQKLANDPRVTRFGAFLRATSLDELPQLFNVVLGDMSIVGPRPIVAPEVPGYENDRAYYKDERFAHYTKWKPGITGLWQVSGGARTAYDERIRLDCWYCRNWSIWLDIMIILQTVRVISSRREG